MRYSFSLLSKGGQVKLLPFTLLRDEPPCCALDCGRMRTNTQENKTQGTLAFHNLLIKLEVTIKLQRSEREIRERERLWKDYGHFNIIKRKAHVDVVEAGFFIRIMTTFFNFTITMSRHIR